MFQSLRKPVNALSCRSRLKEVDLALVILAEGKNRQAAVLDRAIGDDAGLRLIILQGPDLRAHVIGVEVHAVKLREARSTIDGPAGDRLANIMVILPDRLDELLPRPGALRPERVQALAAIPAVVAALLDDVDFLEEILPDVAGPELAGLAVEGHAPDVPQPARPDLRADARADEWVVRRDRVVLLFADTLGRVDVDPQHLAEPAVHVLGVVVGIVRRPAVAVGDVEVAVRTEEDRPAVVVPERL